MKIYLDNCTFNRPFDDQSRVRIRIESEAKLYIQEKIKEGKYKLVWSYILDYENQQNPFVERKRAILKWKRLAEIDIEESEELIRKAKELKSRGVKEKDALHVASAIKTGAKYFITTDDLIIKKLVTNEEIRVMNPMDFIREMEE